MIISKYILYIILVIIVLLVLLVIVANIYHLLKRLYYYCKINIIKWNYHKQIKSAIAGLELYKVLNNKETHYGYKYKPGLNILNGTFNANKNDNCGAGGLYFTHKANIKHFMGFGQHVRKITLPWNDPNFDIVMIHNGYKFRANMIILGNEKIPIEKFLE
jgi:hypothetical protein